MIRNFKLSWGLILITLAVGIFALMQVPAGTEVPTHFDATGTPDQYGSPLFAFMVIPAVQVLVMLLTIFLPKLDPRAQNISQSGHAIRTIAAAFMGITLLVQVIVSLHTLGYRALSPDLMVAGFGVVLMIMGNVLPKTRSNFFFGIKTPWTLSDDEIWQKTHRMGGRMFILGGFALIIVSVFGLVRGDIAVLGMLIPIAIVPIVYSYVLWRKKQNSMA